MRFSRLNLHPASPHVSGMMGKFATLGGVCMITSAVPQINLFACLTPEPVRTNALPYQAFIVMMKHHCGL